MEKEARILIVDDEEDILFSLKFLLKQHFGHVFTEQNPQHLERCIQDYQPNVVLLDMNFVKGRDDGQDGLHWLVQIKNWAPNLPVILMTAYSDVQLAVEALKKGASDFVEKPWRNEKLIATLQAAYSHSQDKKQLEQLTQSQQALSEAIDQGFADMIGASARMQELFHLISKVAPTTANILILGENGTGKELVARAIHRASTRKKNVFIPLDVSAISETLFESEIFGHKKGAFTGAKEDRIGRLEAASGGTLFLDEIGNLPLAVQIKLLQTLQWRHVTPVGSNEARPIDIRLICATNMPLYKMVQENSFRQDLLYRINTVEMNLPPLREREGDISLLAKHYLQVYARKYGKSSLQLHQSALDKLEQYAWPGNVRELQHVMERLVIMVENETIQADEIILNTRSKEAQTEQLSADLSLEEMEKRWIQKALKKHQGNISHTATALGLTRASLYRRLEKHKL